MKKLFSAVVVLSMVFSLSVPAFASGGLTQEWTGGTDATWNTAGNWTNSPSAVPTNIDTAKFDGAGGGNTTINLGAGGTAKTVWFTSSPAAYTIGSGAVGSQTLTLGTSGAVTLDNGVGNNQLFNSVVALGPDSATGTYIITNNSSSKTLTFAGNVSGGAGGAAGAKTLYIEGAGNVTIGGASGIISNGGATAVALTKDQGSGTLTLAGANTYTGATTIGSSNGADAGTIKLSGAGVISSTATIYGGTLDLNGNTQTITTLGLGGGASGSTAAVSIGAGNLRLGGNVTYDATNNPNGATISSTTGFLSLLGDRNFTIGDSSAASSDLTISAIIQNGDATARGLTKLGAGTLVLSGANTYTGGTTISAGTVKLGNSTALGDTALGTTTVSSGAALDLNGQNLFTTTKGLSIAGTGVGGTGALLTSTGSASYSGAITLTADSTLATLSTGTEAMYLYGGIVTGGNNVTFNVVDSSDAIIILTNGISGTGNVIKQGSGELDYTAACTYGGSTAINAGTLALAASDVIPDTTAVTVALGAALSLNHYNDTIGSLSGAGTVKNNSGVSDSLLTVGNSDSTTFSGSIIDGSTKKLGITKQGSGTLTLSGTNTYTGGTTISAGTLAVGSGATSALGTGAVTNNATLDLGTTALSGIGVYTQNLAGAKLAFTINDISTYGTLTSSSAAVVNAGKIAATVNNNIYLPSNTAFPVINTTGAGIDVTNISTTSSDPRVSFALSTSNGILTLTTSRSAGGFASNASNSNESAVGGVLDNVTNASSDMTTVLNTMEGLSSSQTASALNSMQPDTSGATLQVTQATLDQLTDAVLGHQESLRKGPAGISTGDDMLKGLDVWAEGFGSYLHQDPRQLSQGYDASVWGTALGFDLPALKDIRAGTCFGFAQDYVRGKDNSNRDDINSYQWTIYGEYAKDALYIDLSGAFAYNTYDASRQVAVGTISRTASADYSGEQYQLYVEAGYTLNCRKDIKLKSDLNITPLVSFQYQHLYLQRYTESGADSMDLTVKAQNYDIAQNGFGVKLDYPLKTKYGQLIPELRFKWLYDWVGDAQQMTSTFNGGGGSFATNGFNPAQSSWDFGAKLTMLTKNNWTVEANYDFELKDDFYGHYGYVNAKYSF